MTESHPPVLSAVCSKGERTIVAERLKVLETEVATPGSPSLTM